MRLLSAIAFCMGVGIVGQTFAGVTPLVPIRIDFGSSDPGNPTPGWNNMGLTQTGNVKANLFDASFNFTGVDLTITDSFHPYWFLSGSTTGTTFPATATKDGYYLTANVIDGFVEPTGGFAFDNLSPAYTYDVLIYASRVGPSDIREGQYTVAGANSQVLLLNASGNHDNYVVASGISPDANGRISVDIVGGPNNNNGNKLAYLNLVILTPVPEPASLSLIGLGAAALLRRRR